ncbi:MAG: major facilitator superfamily domain-containing protein 1 [Bacteroidales bacterium]|nr:major facilitator superfamily domain-containing protein 1 [Bacteroidales bacterium]
MFFAYMFVDILSPLASLLNETRGWDQGVFGTYAAGEYLLNVFGFLIIAGIILDKMGVRFTGLLSASLMVVGAGIKYIGISDWFQTTEFALWLDSWWVTMPASAKLAMFGFMIFGCGCEMAGTTVSKILAKWFKGKEMALAMGLEMAIARLGVFGAMWLSPMISQHFAINGTNSVTAPLLFASLLLVIGLLNFFVFTIMDKQFDNQLIEDGEMTAVHDPEDEFHVSDLKQIFSSKMFWIIALLCVLYYSAIFPFQRFATNFLEETLQIDNAEAAGLFKWFPILAMVLTPFLGAFIDYKGKGASMMLLGALIMIVCHSVFAFVLPLYPSKGLALATILVLGVSFSLVPASMWPSVPKIIDEKVLGSAYCLIFWVQNIGLCLVPLLIGKLRVATNGYLVPMMVFASFGVLAFLLSLSLKVEDKKKGYGLELPNKK